MSPEVARRLDQRLRIADRKLELAEEATAHQAPAASVAAGEPGFEIAAADGRFKIDLHALLQVDVRQVFTDNASLSDKVDTFLIRRARPILNATLLGVVDVQLAPDFAGGTAALYDAYVDAHPRPWLRVRAGKFKPPVGLERLQTDNYVPFIERALDSNLTAQRDVGVELWGELANAALRYEVAVLNGNADGTITDTDGEHHKTIAGRLLLRPFRLEALSAPADLGLGFAFSAGTEVGTSALSGGAASGTWLSSFKSPGQQTIFSYVSSTSDPTLTVFARGTHQRLNPQLFFYFGSLGLQGEWVHEKQPVATGAGPGLLNNQAGHVTLSWTFGADAGYDGPRFARAAGGARPGPGALQVAVRASWLDIDDVAFFEAALADPTKSVSAARSGGIAVDWWWSRAFKVSTAFEQTRFTGGAKAANRPAESVGFARVQAAF